MEHLSILNELIIRPTGSMNANWNVYDHTKIDDYVAYQPGTRGGWTYSNYAGIASAGDNIYPNGSGDRQVVLKDKNDDFETQGWWFQQPNNIFPILENSNIDYVKVYILGGINTSIAPSGFNVKFGFAHPTGGLDWHAVSGTLYINKKLDPTNLDSVDKTTWNIARFNWVPPSAVTIPLGYVPYVTIGLNEDSDLSTTSVEIDALYVAFGQTKPLEYIPCYLRSESSDSISDNIPLYLYNSRLNTKFVTKRHEYIIRPVTSGAFDSPTSLWTGQLDANTVNEDIISLPGSGAATYGWYSASYPTLGDGSYISATTNDDLAYTTFTMQTPEISGYPKRAYLWILGGFHSTVGTSNSLRFLFAPSGGGNAYETVVSLPNTVDPITNNDYNFSTWSKHSILLPNSPGLSGINTHINPTVTFQPLWSNSGPFDSLRIDSFYVSYEFDDDTLEYLPLYMNAIGEQTLGVDLYLENEVRKSIPIFISGAPNVLSIPLNIFGATTTSTSRNMFLQAMSTSGNIAIPMSVRGSTVGNTFELQPPGSSGLNLFLKTATGTGINYNRDLFLYNDESFVRVGESRNLFLQVDEANSVYNGIGIYLGNNVSGINNYIPLHLYSNQFNSDLETSEGFYPLYDSRDMFLGQYQLELYVPMILQGQPIPMSGGIDMIMVGAQPFNSGVNLVMPVTYDIQTKTLNLFTHGY